LTPGHSKKGRFNWVAATAGGGVQRHPPGRDCGEEGSGCYGIHPQVPDREVGRAGEAGEEMICRVGGTIAVRADGVLGHANTGLV